MDNKLSELSKPVMYVVRTLDGSVASVKNYKYTAPKGFTSNPLYSQEYVSALLSQIEADKEIKARLCRESNNLHDRLKTTEKRIAELGQAMHHIHGAAMDITVPRTAIAKAAELAVEYSTMQEQSNG